MAEISHFAREVPLRELRELLRRVAERFELAVPLEICYATRLDSASNLITHLPCEPSDEEASARAAPLR